MRGTLAIKDHGQLQENSWEAQREKVDYTGTWEWPCTTGPRLVRLCIEQRDDHFMATYLDRDQALPVTDFYDCGAGFYFTLLIGREEHNLRIAEEDTGWLIGEGVLDHGEIKGKIEFYPFTVTPDVPAGRKAFRTSIQDWAPRLIKP